MCQDKRRSPAMTNRNNSSPPLSFTDTHCHIHENTYPLEPNEVLERAANSGVTKIVCVGTDEASSREAVNFVHGRDNCWASIGLHPHDAVHGTAGIDKLRELVNGNTSHEPQDHALHSQTARSVLRETQNAPETHDMPMPEPNFPEDTLPSRQSEASELPLAAERVSEGNLGEGKASRIVAIGECGLDYFYEHSPRQQQKDMLHAQIQLALEHNLPMIFHIRDAFDDFWPIFDHYSSNGKPIKGVVHSFTDTKENMEKAIEKGLYIGVNGILTFTKVEAQKEVYATIPLEKLLLETDAPFLTPTPKRGTVNEPANIRLVAEHLANLKQISLKELSTATTRNANTLFSI
jgi:TatD family hydrolase